MEKKPPSKVRAPSRRQWLRWVRSTLIGVTAVGFLLPISQVLLLNVINPPVTLTMLGRSVQLLRTAGEVRLPARHWVSLEAIPDHVAHAALSSEDARFFDHHGFDWVAIEQAIDQHRSGEGHAGGSSISQQTAKNVFLWQGRSWLRKGLEIWYTFWLDLLVPKHRILEVYLNIAETGPMTFGVDAGAQHWFDCSVDAMTPMQSAQLISLFPSPQHWTPDDPHVLRRAQRITSWASALPEDWRQH